MILNVYRIKIEHEKGFNIITTMAKDEAEAMQNAFNCIDTPKKANYTIKKIKGVRV